MSNSRQIDSDRANDGELVRAVSIGFSSGYHWSLTGSAWGVVVWASRGALTVTVDARVWVLSPQHAVWIPPHTAHAVQMAGRGTLRQVYVAASQVAAWPAMASVMHLSTLAREVLRRMCVIGVLEATQRSHRQLLDLACEELHVGAMAPLELPMPRDPRARRAAQAVRDAPAASRQLSRIAHDAHTSVRTLERLFRAETGVSFGAWRQRARFVHAMAMLADGATVTTVALAVGYDSTSAFVSAFRKATGKTPGHYRTGAGSRGSVATPALRRAPGPSQESPTSNVR